MYKYFTLLFILSFGVTFAKVTISGNVLDASGNIPRLAHAHIAEYGESYYSPLKSIQVNSFGNFQFELEDGLFYGLYVTAAHHQGYYIPLITDKKEIRIDIRLKANEYKDTLEDVRILGNWNGFRTRFAEDMEKQPDGTFVYKLQTDSAKISYQLTGIDKNNHTVNGTMYDELTYDGGGDYISHIKNENGSVDIIFDPGKLVRNHTTFNQINVLGDETLIENADIYKTFTAFKENYQINLDKYITQNKSKDGFEYNYDKIFDYLEQKIESNNNLVKRFGAINYIAALDMANKYSNLKELIELLPVTDPLWVSNGYIIVDIFEKAHGYKAAKEIIDTHFDKIKSQSTKAKILIHYGLQAKENGDINAVTDIHEKLTENFLDLNSQRWFQWYIEQIDPSAVIFKGKQVPQFELELLHNKDIVSNTTLLGKYYLIDFWAVWCAPCRAEMPNLHEIYNEFKDKNFTILSLSFDAKMEDVDKYRKQQWEMPWLHAYVVKGFENEIAVRFEVSGIPKPVLIDPTGKIVATDIELRGDNLKKTLNKFLNTSL